MIHRFLLTAAALVPTILAAQPTPPPAPPPPDQPTLLCWPEAQRAAVVAREKELVAACSPEQLRKWHDLLASEPHVAGTPGDERTVKRLVDAFSEMGLEVRKHDIWPLLCRPTALTLEVVSPERVALFVKEDILKEDPFSANPELLPGWNAYSGNADVTAEVVYANYGTKDDFKKLRELGVDVKGKIVLARYGGNFRGYKAKFAEAAGAAGLIIYTDPADSGYCKGLMYPEGGFANASCIQRGSIVTLPYVGDPLTPGIEATEHAPRLDVKDLDLPKIPVTPVGWGSAQQIIGRMKGAPVPQGWQGGLPFPYRLTGGSELKVRLHVEQERFIAKTSNVIGRLTGATEPEKLVIIGCHHDAWGFGAADPLAGTICLMETARILSEAAKQGKRPARTILFCAWGAEEFGIIGSTEWVEANREELISHGVSYINLDMAAMGLDFGASATPSMQQVIADVTHHVPQPGGGPGRTVFDAWLSRSKDPLNLHQPAFGNMGGGSDHEAFVCHVGMAAAGLGAGGSQGTSYHSTYDNLQWYRRTVGDDYEPALMITRVTTLATHRLAFAPVLPLNAGAYGREVGRALDVIIKRAGDLGWSLIKPTEPPADPRDTSPMLVHIRANRVEGVRRAAGEKASAIQAAEAARRRDWPKDEWPGETCRSWNTSLLRADRAWMSQEGLPGRPWFHNHFIAPDEDSGYASWPLPALRRATEQKDDEALGDAVESLEAAIQRMRVE